MKIYKPDHLRNLKIGKTNYRWLIGRKTVSWTLCCKTPPLTTESNAMFCFVFSFNSLINILQFRTLDALSLGEQRRHQRGGGRAGKSVLVEHRLHSQELGREGIRHGLVLQGCQDVGAR